MSDPLSCSGFYNLSIHSRVFARSRDLIMATGVGNGLPGRPEKFVEREQLEYLRSLRFTWSETASLLGVSSKTLQRKAKEWNISTYSSISDDCLDEMVQQIGSRFPTSGEVMIRGHLNSQKVPACMLSYMLAIISGIY